MGVGIIRNNKIFASNPAVILNYVNQSGSALNYAIIADRIEGS